MEKIKILQEHVNKFVATTDDFWKTFHQSLAAPFHPWNEFKNNSLKLSDREWICPKCGKVHDRDENAAKNIENEGLKIYKGSRTAYVDYPTMDDKKEISLRSSDRMKHVIEC